MSGSHYTFGAFHLECLSDDISFEISENQILNPTENISSQTKNKILTEAKNIVETLKSLSSRVRELEGYLEGDLGAKSYCDSIKETRNRNYKY